MLGDVIQKYGPSTILIAIAVYMFAKVEGFDSRIGDLQAMNVDRFNTEGTRLGTLEQGQAEIRERLARVETKVEAIDERLARVDTKVDAMSELVDEVARGVSALQGVGGPNEPR